ncbi:MAG: response regulator [Firmicutes bacterium]|jgi:signal transduction histidine kinase/CheY-like chemotaxis protein/HPt (histidine-containing phosphotransfer) domain-containing protein|nr:response regulator [Bacillota bacterium]NBI63455.1 response regulator [Clostridiales bacterium]
MKASTQTSTHLLMAITTVVLSIMLSIITLIMSWELWMIPLTIIGSGIVWWLHIGRIGSVALYEHLCAGVMMVEFFFFGVHEDSLFDIPLIACTLLLIFSLPDRRRLLYMTAAIYVLMLLYHALFLHTITADMESDAIIRLVLGTVVTAGALELARYQLNRRKEAYKKHSVTLAELEAAGRQNAEFLSNVSHELRTPINMVIGISEVALGKDIPPDIREDMQSIQLAGKRLSSQINNILDYTESVEGTLTAANEEYMITSVINDVITMVTVQNSKHNLELVFDIDPKIPSVLIGDAEKISHVLKILLENSIKFTDEGGINICVGFREEKYGINLIIDVYDTGIGMTSSQLTQIHDDFYQADSGSRRFAGGLGLGIPIARALLHAMGGFIHFESKDHGGLEAHITIPQGVANHTPSIVIPQTTPLCIVCYFKPDRFGSDEVRKYYDRMILHLVDGLGIEGYQAHNFESLLKIKSEHKLSHVFIAQAEYLENTSYYEDLARTIRVIVIADKNFTLNRDSRLLIIRKPLFMLSIVNLINGEIQRNHLEDDQATGRSHFFCTGVRALAVDDEEMNLVVAKGILGSYGIQVDTCLSGKEAIEKCTHMSYDLVFLDHMMPGFDGMETLRRIREIDNGIYKDLPIIALTANTISGAREMFKSEGFTEFVPKPIERTILERVLRRVLPEHCIRYEQYDKLPALESSLPENEDQPADAPTSNVLQEEQPSNTSAATDDAQLQSDVSTESEALPYAELTNAGINAQIGLDYCCGEVDFYREMLQMFYFQSNEKKEEIISLYEAADWADYAVKVHALKSTSLTIGAEDLSSQAKALEQAGKKGDSEYIQTNHMSMLRAYEEVCDSISQLIDL